MAVELRQLRALVAVVDQGTFTDAAVALGTTQASVSRAVAALERALGCRVLRRNTRSVTLTAAGTRVLRHARRVLDEVAAVVRAVDAEETELRIGYAWAALGRHTRAVQDRWASEHPGSQLVLVHSETRSAGLAEGLADVAVIRGDQADDPRFARVLIGQEDRVAALARDDPLARRRRLTMADFAGRTVGLSRQIGATTPELWPAGDGPAVLRQVGGVDEWLTLIAAGQAIGLTSQATAVQYPRLGVVYRPVTDAPSLPVWLCWWRDDPPRYLAALQAVIRAVIQSGGVG